MGTCAMSYSNFIQKKEFIPLNTGFEPE